MEEEGRGQRKWKRKQKKEKEKEEGRRREGGGGRGGGRGSIHEKTKRDWQHGGWQRQAAVDLQNHMVGDGRRGLITSPI